MQILTEQRLNPECIRILSWNVKKQSRPQLNTDLAEFSRDIDIALLQEVHVEGDYLHHFSDHWHRSFAPGFAVPGRTTGVMTLSSAGHRSHSRVRHTEPLLRTTKASNITSYALEGHDDALLVVNLHAVNFSLGLNAYSRQLHDLLYQVDEHQGPVIFAGDFNAWHLQRKQLLDEIALHRGLEEVMFTEDHRSRVFGRYLDFIFVRGLHVHDSRSHHSDASDHNPLLATVGL